MRLSTERILTTHVGSLPRPAPMLELIEAQERGEPVEEAAFERCAEQAVADCVAEQVANGVDIVSDGEMSKLAYTFYVRHRLSGIGDRPADAPPAPPRLQQDMLDHPDFLERVSAARGGLTQRFRFPACTGPVAYADKGPLEADLRHLSAAVAAAWPVEAFMTAASPGVITNFVDDLYYKSHDAYLAALAEAMRVEFEAIHAAGFILQLDCPDLGSGRHNRFKDLSEAEFLKLAAANLEALDAATVNIPSEAMRLHICWGNYEGPHTRDIELGAIFGLLAKARPQAISFEAANPRHEWEWEALAGLDIPDDTVLIPGVVDSTTNFVEHERLVAQRILNFARVVGRERVIAGADCGFATFAGRDPQVAPSIVWAKFRSLAAGARLASEALWP